MTDRREEADADADADADTDADWPVELRGVTESIVSTLGPNDRWNLAALGVHAPEDDEGAVTARTYGNTRTRRNFERQGGGVVQFVTDSRDFVDAALSIREVKGPVVDSAAAWVDVSAEQVDSAIEGETTIRTWELTSVESEILQESVPTINRGFGAVVEATVAASRLDVPAFDTDELLDRLVFFADVVDRAGGPAEQEAFARIDEHIDWRARLDA